MKNYIDINTIVVDKDTNTALKRVANKYLKHEFDLLGSGYVQISYHMECKGFQGIKYDHRDKYASRKDRVIHDIKPLGDYDPINWFIDYRSGYYYDPDEYNDIRKCLDSISQIAGVDIKCPWELGRFYHLVRLAVLAINSEELRRQIVCEFRNEIFDFVLENPIGKTVQWSCTMDVAIRAVNLLLSYDILSQLNEADIFDEIFISLFEKHIADTLEFIVNHLEKGGRHNISNNHYLADIVGVLFCTAYLERNPNIDKWMLFVARDLVREFDRQFFYDGTNIELSTSYHRLSSEITLYGTALIIGIMSRNTDCIINDQGFSFPEYYLLKLYRAACFTNNILNQNNEIVQIGDNDDGRLVKLTPVFVSRSDTIIENGLDHRTLISGMAGLYNNINIHDSFPLEHSFIQALTSEKFERFKINDEIDLTPVIKNPSVLQNDLSYSVENVIYNDDSNTDLKQNCHILYYGKWGLIIYRSNRLFLSFLVGCNDKVLGGHVHNDGLSIELMVDGIYITRDPGSYVYTADKSTRDAYRCTQGHNVIWTGTEQNKLTDYFTTISGAHSRLIQCDENTIAAEIRYNGVKSIRKILIYNNNIKVVDYCNRDFSVDFSNKNVSVGYGVKG